MHPTTIRELPPLRTTSLGLAGLCLSMLLSALDTSIANVALPTLADTFAAPFATVQWVVLAYLLTVTSFLVAAGRLGDLLGRRRLLGHGIALFTLASGLCAAAPTIGVLIAARALQGLGGAVMIAHTIALAGAAVPPQRLGRAMGLLGSMSAVGTALGPSLGGALIAAAGWRTLFWSQLPLGALALFLVLRGLPAEPRPTTRRPRLDPLGTTLLAATLAAYALAMTNGRESTGTAAPFAVAAAACAIAFAFVESKVASPLLRLDMLKNGALGTGLLMAFLVSTVAMATLVVGPFHLGRGLGLDAASVGAAMSLGPAVAAATGIPAGRLVDRLGAPTTTLLGLTMMVAGALALAMMPLTAGLPGYLAPLGVVTAGYALFQAANNTAVVAGADRERRGLVSGLLNLARNLGLVTGVAAMGSVFAAAVGGTDVASALPEAIGNGTRTTFAAASALAGLGWSMAFVRMVVARRRGRARAAAGSCAIATSSRTPRAPVPATTDAPDPRPIADATTATR